MGAKTRVIAGIAALGIAVLAMEASAGTGTGSAGAPAPLQALRAAPGGEAKHDQLERVETLLGDATPGSAARFRLQEDRERLVRCIDLAGQLEHLGHVRAHATPGSPAQFRTVEESDSLRQKLEELDCRCSH